MEAGEAQVRHADDDDRHAEGHGHREAAPEIPVIARLGRLLRVHQCARVGRPDTDRGAGYGGPPAFVGARGRAAVATPSGRSTASTS